MGRSGPSHSAKQHMRKQTCTSACPFVWGSAKQLADALGGQPSSTAQQSLPAELSGLPALQVSCATEDPPCRFNILAQFILCYAVQGKIALNRGATEPPAILMQYISWFCALLTSDSSGVCMASGRFW